MSPLALKALPFLAWRHRVNRKTLRLDLMAGLVAAVMVLPQGVAFAKLAGMPPEYGLYGAMLPAIVGALWGSSWHLVSGPTNATSLMVFATVGALAVPFTPTYVALVLTLNLMVGLMKLGLGLARLGSLVNFISTAVVIGFTAGAGLLIIGAQLRNFFGISVPQEPTFLLGLRDFVTHLHETDPAVLAVGAFTLLAAIAGKRWWPRVPYMLTGIVLGALFAWVLGLLNIAHVQTIGALPSAVPPLSLPDLSLQTWQTLAPIALALMVIGLSEAISSARAVALKSGQRIDGNQEFIGQGLANIVGAFTSSYPTSGSFNRTGANYEAGARTPLACVFSAILLLVIFMITAPMMQGGVDISLPQAQSRPLESKDGLAVTVNSKGEIFIGNEKFSLGDFRVSFKTVAQNRTRNGVYLRADKSVDYGLVVQILAIMRGNGVADVGLVTEPEVIR